MYRKNGVHRLVCTNKSIFYDRLSQSSVLSVWQLPLLNGGFYTKVLGTRYKELVFEGTIVPTERNRFDTFIETVSASAVTLSADNVQYIACTLISSEISFQPDSGFCKYKIVFRRY